MASPEVVEKHKKTFEDFLGKIKFHKKGGGQP